MSTFLLILCFVFVAGTFYFLYRLIKDDSKFAVRNLVIAVICLVLGGLCVRGSIGIDEDSNSSYEYYDTSSSSRSGSNPSFKGKHCTGSVGCDCSGFKAITSGKEWEKAFCKHCGHHRSDHR